MSEQALLAIASGLGIGVLGVLIRYAGMTQLIAGYDPNCVTDPEELANFIGRWTLVVVAVLTVSVGLLDG